ncbi:MAG TPA: hypothetical protein VMV45_01815 [Casimicrobiaceae bacterium]|nr:hypothetical protein [Casimicrobiaceae bacterium]
MRARFASMMPWLAVVVATPALAQQDVCSYPYRVGFTVTRLDGIDVALWYPTRATPQIYDYTASFSGYVAPHATPACGRVPLVVFSHGLGGCGTQSLYFTEELARHGYVVAAPDHADATLCTVNGGTGDPANMIPQEPFAQPQLWSADTYADRAADLEAIIDALLSDRAFAPIIDPLSIGAAGHSLGGYTVLGLAGAWPSWKDARIRAVLALSPYIEPCGLQATLGTLDVPVMYQGAQLDVGITPTLTGPDGAYAQTSSPKYFAELFGGTHYVWSNLGCGDTPSVQACLVMQPDPRMVDLYGIAFLDRYLKGLRTPILNGNGAGLADWEQQP